MSARVANPIIRKIEDNQDALDFFESVTLPEEDEKTQDIILGPSVKYRNGKIIFDSELQAELIKASK